jgi:hypothetical protein
VLRINAENAPQTVIFEGDMSPEKSAALRQLGCEILHKHRRDPSDSEALTSTLVHENRHPDLIEFSGESVLIGSEKDAPPGTIRHLQRKILPYAPWKSNARVVIFQNAAGVKDEAETAMLKTLEEPPVSHYFFLSVPTAEILKETIRSRAVITRVYIPLGAQSLPADPWLRFYHLAGVRDFMQQYPDATEKLVAETRAACDTLAYSNDDFQALERILYTVPRQLFDKETITVQTRALRFAILPFLAALRDRLTEGHVAPLAPIALNRIPVVAALRATDQIRGYLRNLETRIFGNRPLNQQAVFYSFYFRFFPLWTERARS